MNAKLSTQSQDKDELLGPKQKCRSDTSRLDPSTNTSQQYKAGIHGDPAYLPPERRWSFSQFESIYRAEYTEEQIEIHPLDHAGRSRSKSFDRFESEDTICCNSVHSTPGMERSVAHPQMLSNAESTRIHSGIKSLDNSGQYCPKDAEDAWLDDKYSAGNILKFAQLRVVTRRGKELIDDCFGSIRSGDVMAIIGPSGAGKTTLIRALTLQCLAGCQTTGSVTLNGRIMTENVFRQNCYVVKQDANLWPHLTCRETLLFAAELFHMMDKTKIPFFIDDIIQKMGLQSCSNTKCSALSGGQKRRLSSSVALLKKPAVLFLDEPTTGLDSASATKYMEEIQTFAKKENLIVLCTIHQPSSKVFHQFDQLMIMSKGRQAFVGDAAGAERYFKRIGYEIPESTNPADYYLDLVNSDFSSTDEVVKILDEWKEQREEAKAYDVGYLDNNMKGNIFSDFSVLIHRHSKLMIRDPFLYRGRLIGFFFASCHFALIYLKARPFKQAQALNKTWAYVWMIGIPCFMNVALVYGMSIEYKQIMAEAKNGLVTPISYIFAKSILSLPFVLLSAIILSFAGWVIQGSLVSSFDAVIGIWTLAMLYHECLAEAFAILCNEPIMGMLGYIFICFATLLFNGLIISIDDMIWPFKTIYYITPFSYAARSSIYALFVDATWDSCTDSTMSAVCIPSTDGKDVLDEIGRFYALITSNNTIHNDVIALVEMTLFWKLVSTIVFLFKTRTVSRIKHKWAK